jgi:hypothetical protein
MTQQCRQRLMLVATIMLALLLLDWSCGPELSPWIAYAVPVALAARCCGFSMGAAYAVIAGWLLYLAARHAGHPYSTEAYYFVSVSSQTIALLVIAWLTARLSNLERTLRGLRTWAELRP